MPRLFRNSLGGVVDDAPLTIAATTINSSTFDSLPEVVAPDTLDIVLDPDGDNGDPEIVSVTAHAAAATSVTAVRGQQSTTAREHAQNTVWRHTLTRTAIEELVEPAGIVKAFAGSTAPSRHLLCDGSAVSRTTYARLFSAIGTTWGAGNGSTTFNVPDLRGKGIMFLGTASPFNVLAATGGSKDAVVVSHNHTQVAHSHTINHDHPAGTTSTDGNHTHTDQINETPAGAGSTTQTGPGQAGAAYGTLTTSSDGAHNHTFNVAAYSGDSGSATPAINSSGVSGTDANLQPYAVLNAIITV